MKFEYRLSSIGYGNIPDLVVPVSEIHKIVRLKDKEEEVGLVFRDLTARRE